MMPGLLIGMRHGMPLLGERQCSTLRLQTPMQCKLWDNRVQPIAASVYSIYFFTQVPIASYLLSAMCVAVL